MTRAMKRRNRRKARRMYVGGHPRQARSGNALISQMLRDLLPADPAIFERDLEDTRTYVQTPVLLGEEHGVTFSTPPGYILRIAE